jgi:hypothetical protein
MQSPIQTPVAVTHTRDNINIFGRSSTACDLITTLNDVNAAPTSKIRHFDTTVYKVIEKYIGSVAYACCSY